MSYINYEKKKKLFLSLIGYALQTSVEYKPIINISLRLLGVEI
jgi:hypothetical protein